MVTDSPAGAAKMCGFCTCSAPWPRGGPTNSRSAKTNQPARQISERTYPKHPRTLANSFWARSYSSRSARQNVYKKFRGPIFEHFWSFYVKISFFRPDFGVIWGYFELEVFVYTFCEKLCWFLLISCRSGPSKPWFSQGGSCKFAKIAFFTPRGTLRATLDQFFSILGYFFC